MMTGTYQEGELPEEIETIEFGITVVD